jgi:predicted nucleic acid-binding protein
MHKIVVPVVEELLEEIKEKFTVEKLEGYLTSLRDDILDNVTRFHQKEEQPQSVLGMTLPREEDDFKEYQVNVVVDNSDVSGVPIILEKNPRYKNLFGTVDQGRVHRKG